MPDRESQKDLDDLPPERDLRRPLAPYELWQVLQRFRKAGDRQGEILITDMLGYAGTSAAKAPEAAEDPLEAIHGPSGGLTPFDQERLLADQERLDREFEETRPKPDKRRIPSVKDIAIQLRLPDIFQRPISQGTTQHRLFSETEFQYLKSLASSVRGTRFSIGQGIRKITSRAVDENLSR